MESSGQDEETSLTQEIPEWTMEFVKTFVQMGDLIHKELGGETDSTIVKILKGGATALAGGISALVGGPSTVAISKTIAASIGVLGKSGQERDRLALEHSINPNGGTKEFQMNYRKTLIKCALQICHSYEIQFRCVYRKIMKNPFSPGSSKKKQSEKSQMQAIQKLAAYAASCCVSHLIEKQKVENPHTSTTKPSIVSKIKSWYKQLMEDGIRFEWSNENEVSMTTAKFFQVPIPAFYSHCQGTNDDVTAMVLILAEKNADGKGEKIWHELRRPFDFETHPDYYKKQSFVKIKILLPPSGHEIRDVGDPSEFVSKDYSTEQIDRIYNELIDDSTFDMPELLLKNLSSIKETTEQTAKDMTNCLEILDNVATSQLILLAGWTKLEQILKSTHRAPIWFNVQDPTDRVPQETNADKQNLKVRDGDDNQGALKLINEICQKGLKFITSDGNADSSQIINLLTKGFCKSLNINMEFWLEMMTLMAQILNSKGRYDEATEVNKIVYGKKMEMEKDMKMNKYIEMELRTMMNKGDELRDQKKYQESLEMFTKVYEGRRNMYHENHPQVLLAMKKMAFVLLAKGENKESLEMYNKIYKGRLTIFPPDHLGVLDTMVSVAYALRRCGKFQESFEMWNEVYEIQKKSLKPQHPDILLIRERISQVLWDLERYDESISILQDVVDIRITAFSADDPKTVSLSNQLAEKKAILSCVTQ